MEASTDVAVNQEGDILSAGVMRGVRTGSMVSEMLRSSASGPAELAPRAATLASAVRSCDRGARAQEVV
jgi:hypothetical protein